MINFQYQVGTVVEMKKPHPCASRSSQFTIVKTGADIKMKCMGCGNVMMLSRDHFNHRIRKIITPNL
ncbi:MAG: hypothetical protein RL379_133 [Bacillota bacterium]|jgi:hypothetical protein